MTEQVYTNYRLILGSGEITGTLVARGGRIADVRPGTSRAAGATDGDGAFLLPGLVELHTDHLEACLSPRPGARWPLDAALRWYDRDLLGAGITTACAAVAVREVPGQPVDRARVREVVDSLREGVGSGTLRADHRVNLRCELSTPDAADVLTELLDAPNLATVSLMDHAPGQRQFMDPEKFRAYYRKRYDLSDDALSEYERSLRALDPAQLADRRQRIAALARSRALCLASHDDATEAHIVEALADGVTVAEFPTTELASARAKAAGLTVLMGGPNVVLDRSHSGNLSARAAAEAGCLDALSSDYAPRSLLHAAFLLARAVGWSLPAAIAAVTATPARALGLTDRGTLAPGNRADFLIVREVAGLPALEAVYVAGVRVA